MNQIKISNQKNRKIQTTRQKYKTFKKWNSYKSQGPLLSALINPTAHSQFPVLFSATQCDRWIAFCNGWQENVVAT